MAQMYSSDPNSPFYSGIGHALVYSELQRTSSVTIEASASVEAQSVAVVFGQSNVQAVSDLTVFGQLLATTTVSSSTDLQVSGILLGSATLLATTEVDVRGVTIYMVSVDNVFGEADVSAFGQLIGKADLDTSSSVDVASQILGSATLDCRSEMTVTGTTIKFVIIINNIFANSYVDVVGQAIGSSTINCQSSVYCEPWVYLTAGSNIECVSSVEAVGWFAEWPPYDQAVDAQLLTADGIVEMYEITLTNGSKLFLKPFNTVTWQGKTFEGTWLKFSGDKKTASEEASRPTLSVFNPNGVYCSFIGRGLLNRAQVIRYRILKKHVMTDRPLAKKSIYVITRVPINDESVVTFELRKPWDLPNFVTPARMYMPPEFPSVSL